MSLYLVQHGKSLSKDADPEEGLSEEGRTDVQFQNGGIVCLDKGPGEQAWIVKWSLSPNIGRRRFFPSISMQPVDRRGFQ